MKIIPILILLNTTAFLITAYLRVGILSSISAHFYSNTLRKWFKAFLWANAFMVTLYDKDSTLLMLAGWSLVAVPIFADFMSKPTAYFHYFFAGSFFATTSAYIGWQYTVVMAIAFIVGKLKLNVSIYWLEVAGIVALVTGLLVH